MRPASEESREVRSLGSIQRGDTREAVQETRHGSAVLSTWQTPADTGRWRKASIWLDFGALSLGWLSAIILNHHNSENMLPLSWLSVRTPRFHPHGILGVAAESMGRLVCVKRDEETTLELEILLMDFQSIGLAYLFFHWPETRIGPSWLELA